MNKYQNGKIYKIVDNTNDDIYIGSTIRGLRKRLYDHKASRNTDNRITKSMIDNGNYSIHLIEDCPCEDKYDLLKREQYWIDNTKCINQKPAYVNHIKTEYDKSRYENNKEEVKRQTMNLYNYKSSWGGDKRSNNNLLMINPNLFK